MNVLIFIDVVRPRRIDSFKPIDALVVTHQGHRFKYMVEWDEEKTVSRGNIVRIISARRATKLEE